MDGCFPSCKDESLNEHDLNAPRRGVMSLFPPRPISDRPLDKAASVLEGTAIFMFFKGNSSEIW